jgi:REP element-mobilizing transposase RayT
MPRKTRSYKPNAYYHVYNRGNNKKIVFRNEKDKSFFIGNLISYSKKYKITLESYCIMRNHYHIILKTGVRPEQLSRMMQAFSTQFAQYINRKYNLVGHVFQGRYQAKYLRRRNDLLRTKKYLKSNPVKASYTERAEDYRWLKI